MRWRHGRRSTNVDDRRGRRMAAGGMKLGGGMIIVVIIIGLITGQNPLQLLQQLGGSNLSGPSTQGQGRPPEQRSAAEQEQADFAVTVLGFTEDVWTELFRQQGQQYKKPTLVLFDNNVRSRCGVNSEATGPFYCPGDQNVYLSLSFFRQLEQLGAPGEFARAYVIGHEVGHHIQTITGITPRVRQMQQSSGSRSRANELSVQMELQADCLAGVWAHHANKKSRILEPGDVEAGIQAAASIGDDRLQKRAGRKVDEESFTHGTSRQRVEWLRRGLQSGNVDVCDTFGWSS